MDDMQIPKLLSGLTVLVEGDDLSTITVMKSRLRQVGAQLTDRFLPTSVSLSFHADPSDSRVTSAYPWTSGSRLARILADEIGLSRGYRWRRERSKLSVHFHNLPEDAVNGIVRGLFLWIVRYDHAHVQELLALPSIETSTSLFLSTLPDNAENEASIVDTEPEQDMAREGQLSPGESPAIPVASVASNKFAATPVNHGPIYLQTAMIAEIQTPIVTRFTQMGQIGVGVPAAQSQGRYQLHHFVPARHPDSLRTFYKP